MFDVDSYCTVISERYDRNLDRRFAIYVDLREATHVLDFLIFICGDAYTVDVRTTRWCGYQRHIPHNTETTYWWYYEEEPPDKRSPGEYRFN